MNFLSSIYAIRETDQGRTESLWTEESFIGLKIQVISWVSDDKKLHPIAMCNEEEDPGTERIMDIELGVHSDQ